MPLTQAEKSKRYREKLKRTNPEKYSDMKKKNKARAIKAYQNKKNTLNDAQKEEHRLKLRQTKTSNRQTIHTFQSTCSEQSANTQHQEDEDCSNEKNEELQNNLAAEVLDTPNDNKTESGSSMYLNRTSIRNIQRNIEKKIRRENNQLRENVQKLMRGYNSLQREMRKLKNEYRELAKKLQEKDAETENQAIRQDPENTPYKRSESFVNEHLANVATPEKEIVKRKMLEYNVLTDSIKSKFKICRNQDKNTFKDVVDNPIVKKYKLKSCLTKRLGLKNSLKRHTETKTKTHDLIERIRRFYERDDVSRASAGKKECRTFKKCKMQVRYLLDKLETLHKKYVSEVGSISYSTFKKYRPFYVISPDLKNLETCACLKHCNMQFLINALKSAGIFESNDVNTILANFVCDPIFRQCMYGECDFCQDNAVKVNTDENVEIKWFAWNVKEHEYDEKGERKKTKRMVKTENKGTIKSVVDLFNNEIKKYKVHIYNMRHQYQQYKLCIDSLDYSECALHVDFSENWLCKYHEEVQAMHFGASKKQITLHTGMLYIKNEKPLSVCSISPENSHNPEAIWAHLDPILKYIRHKYPNIQTVHFFSDGPTSQYRQKKNFFLMSRYTYELGFNNFTWSYFEASHGKGAADGVGGTIKRTLDFKVSHGTDIPDAQTAFDVLQETETSVKLFFIPSESIQTLDTSIASKLTPIRNTLKIHQIVSHAKFIVKHRILSCFCQNLKGKCECFDPEIHSFEFEKESTLDENGSTRLELDETTGELKQVTGERNDSFEINVNEMCAEEELFNWTQDCYLLDNLDIDERNINVNILNDSGMLNALECDVKDIAEKEKYVKNDTEAKIYNPDSLNMLCMKVANIYMSLSDQSTKELAPSNLSISTNESIFSARSSKLIITSNVKVSSKQASEELKKIDIKKKIKGSEVINNTQLALKMKIVPKEKKKNNQNNALRETVIFNKNASTSKEPDSKRKRKNVTSENTAGKSCGKKGKMNIKSTEKSKVNKKAAKKKKIRTYSYIESSSEDSDILSLADTDNSEYETYKDYITTSLDEQEGKENLKPTIQFGYSDIEYFTGDDDFLKKDDWIVAKFAAKKSLKHFIGRVLSIKDNIPTVKFVRKVKNSKGSKGLIFTYPNVEDVCEMQLDDVIKVLPQPNISRRGQIMFDTDITQYNIQ